MTGHLKMSEPVAFGPAESFLESDRLHETSCLIIDIQFPGINGLQLHSDLAAAGYKIPILFITAYDHKESRRQAMQAGAVAFPRQASRLLTSCCFRPFVQR